MTTHAGRIAGAALAELVILAPLLLLVLLGVGRGRPGRQPRAHRRGRRARRYRVRCAKSHHGRGYHRDANGSDQRCEHGRRERRRIELLPMRRSDGLDVRPRGRLHDQPPKFLRQGGRHRNGSVAAQLRAVCRPACARSRSKRQRRCGWCNERFARPGSGRVRRCEFSGVDALARHHRLGRALYTYHLVSNGARLASRYAIVNGIASCAGGSPDPLQTYVTGQSRGITASQIDRDDDVSPAATRVATRRSPRTTHPAVSFRFPSRTRFIFSRRSSRC